jgi:hypothetical protein
MKIKCGDCALFLPLSMNNPVKGWCNNTECEMYNHFLNGKNNRSCNKIVKK